MTENEGPIEDGDALAMVELTPESLTDIELGALRAARDRAVGTETGLSYLRRMVQGPLDLVRGELERRAGGGHADLADLVEDLPRILSESGGPGGGRLPQTLQPGDVDPALSARLDAITAGGMRIADVPTESDEELVALAGELDTLERTVSRRRRIMHRAIDLLNVELAGRYRSGAATVDGALPGAGPVAG